MPGVATASAPQPLPAQWGVSLQPWGPPPAAVHGAPPWPYPERNARTVPGFNLLFGIVFIASGLFVVPMLLLGMSMGSLGDVAPFFVFLLFPFMGIGFLRTALRERALARQLFASGTRCWARIASIAPGAGARVVNGMRYARVILEVDAYPAQGQAPQQLASYREAPRSAFGRIQVDWFVSQFQLMQAQPGSYCALLVDPADPKRHHLEGFADGNGNFTPIQ